MQYAEISEAWNSPLNNKIREVEENQRAFSNQVFRNQFNNRQEDDTLLVSGGSIIPAGESHTESIDTYLQNNKHISNETSKKPSNDQRKHINVPIENDPNQRTYINVPVENDPNQRTYINVPIANDPDYSTYERISRKQASKNIYDDEDYNNSYRQYKKAHKYNHYDDMYYLRKKNKEMSKHLSCDKISKHIKKCKHCYDKYNKNDYFMIALDYKNALLIILLIMAIMFVAYYLIKKN
jgi:hypothetical protein